MTAPVCFTAPLTLLHVSQDCTSNKHLGSSILLEALVKIVGASERRSVGKSHALGTMRILGPSFQASR